MNISKELKNELIRETSKERKKWIDATAGSTGLFSKTGFAIIGDPYYDKLLDNLYVSTADPQLKTKIGRVMRSGKDVRDWKLGLYHIFQDACAEGDVKRLCQARIANVWPEKKAEIIKRYDDLLDAL